MSRSVDEIHRDMKAARIQWLHGPNPSMARNQKDIDYIKAIGRLIQELPEPPKPDPVKECTKRFQVVASTQTDEEAMRDALLRYRELGCPELEDE